LFAKSRHIIVAIIDFFHRPFARLIPIQTFRYLACGGSNTVLNIFLYYVAYNFVLHKHNVPIYGNINITSPIAAYIIAFCISFPIGFILSRHIVFPESNLHGRVQFFRYAIVTATFILFNYFFIKVSVEWTGMFAEHTTIAYTISNITIAIMSYISQRKFTFKTHPGEEEEVVAEEAVVENTPL